MEIPADKLIELLQQQFPREVTICTQQLYIQALEAENQKMEEALNGQHQ